MENKKDIPGDIQAVLELYVGKNFESVETESMIEILIKRGKRFYLMIFVNILALIFFSYSFLNDITQISDFVYYALGAVFVMNISLIFYQRKQLNRTLEYLRNQL
jgi:magnesium-transporting ATPase (P-type)